MIYQFEKLFLQRLLALYWSFSSGVGVKFAQSSSQWEAGPIPADQLKARKPGLSIISTSQ
jgi:hypothetical protein